jgi:hypothetical protein
MAADLDPQTVSNMLMQTTPNSGHNPQWEGYKRYPNIWDFLDQNPNAQKVPNPHLVPMMLPESGIYMNGPAPTPEPPENVPQQVPDQRGLWRRVIGM